MGDAKNLLNAVSRLKEEVSTDTYTTTWREILNSYTDGDIAIDPDYQRLFRWSLEQQTEFVESLLLNIPTPALFFSIDKDGKQEVMDGLQRISTIIKFFASEVQPSVDYGEEESVSEVNNITVPTVLLDGPLLEDLAGHTRESLPDNLIRTIKYGRVPVVLLESNSSLHTKYIVFRRLNRSGEKLSDQEIRNCTARMWKKTFPTDLRDLAQDDIILSALSLKKEHVQRMDVEELILRMLALDTYLGEFKGSFAGFLDDFMEYAASGNFELDKSTQSKVIRTFELINEALPNGDAFRFLKEGVAKGAFSANIFDIVSIGVYRNLDRLTPQLIQERHQVLMTSDELKAVTGAGSNAKAKIVARVDLGTRVFAV